MLENPRCIYTTLHFCIRCPTVVNFGYLFYDVVDISAPLAMDIPQDVVMRKLKILLQVAEFHNFEWLLETVEQLLVSQ